MAFQACILAGLFVGTGQVPTVEPALVQSQSDREAGPDRKPGADAAPGEEIIVIGDRLAGRASGDIAYDYQLGPEDVESYAAGKLTELLEALGPLTRRARGGGTPITLLNGQRISSFLEIADLPPEAVARVEIFPEEKALQYGFRPDQRVVNFILRPRFRATTTQTELGLAAAGRRGTYQADFNVLRINQNGRWSLDAAYQHLTPLFESGRELIETDPGTSSDLGRSRTLLSGSERLSLSGTFSRTILGNVPATVNARFDASSSLSFLGLSSASLPDRLTRKSHNMTGQAGLSLYGGIGQWHWSATASYARSSGTIVTETGRGHDLVHTLGSIAGAELVANASIAQSPAGELSVSLKAGFETRSFDSSMEGAAVRRSGRLSRHKPSAQASLDLPIASRARGVLGRIGDLSLNVNGAVAYLSDFGTLRTVGFGINWSPIDKVRLIASLSDDEGAPSIQQLGDPALLNPAVRLFDFSRGETVLVEQVEGGNPGLLVANRRLASIAVAVRPFKTDITLTAGYTDTKIRNAIAIFPAVTSEMEVAFPERVVRDELGRLVRIDTRPVNFARAGQQELRSGINYSALFGGWARAANTRGSPPSARAGAGRLQLSLFHTWRLKDDILIRGGHPKLDLLNGSAFGSRGGRSRHDIQFETGIFRHGLGARLSASWQSGTYVRGSLGNAAASSELFFSDLTTVNLRLFADLGQQERLVRDNLWLRGMRVTVAVDNLFASRPKVRDRSGAKLVGYEPAFLDPIGRSVRIGLRKQFAN